MNLFDLSGKTAIVTGGGKGIGRQMAQGLAEAGANVVLCARQADRCEQAAAELEQLGVKALGLGCDVRDPEQVAAVVERTVADFGTVDVLVNNAGTVWGAPPEDMPLEGWQKVVDVNMTGVFLFSQAAGRTMIDGDGGSIVNIASVAGLHGSPGEITNSVVYHATKEASSRSLETSRASGPITGFASTRSRPAGFRRTWPTSCSSATATSWWSPCHSAASAGPTT